MLDIGLKNKYITTQEFIIKIHYSLSLRIHSECRKIRTGKTPHLDTFHAVLQKYNIKRESNELKETNIKNCRCYYLDYMFKI